MPPGKASTLPTDRLIMSETAQESGQSQSSIQSLYGSLSKNGAIQKTVRQNEKKNRCPVFLL